MHQDLLAFFEMFPSPLMISAMTMKEFTKAAWEVVGRKVGKSLMLSDIYETTKASAGLPVAPDSDAIRTFRLMLAEGRSPIRQRSAIEDRTVELLAGRPDNSCCARSDNVRGRPRTSGGQPPHHHRQMVRSKRRDARRASWPATPRRCQTFTA